MLRELEVVILLLAILHRPPLRAEFARFVALLVGEELLLPHRVMAGLLVLVDLAFVEKPLQNAADTALVEVIRRRRPAIVLHVELPPQRHELRRYPVHER